MTDGDAPGLSDSRHALGPLQTVLIFGGGEIRED